MKDFRKRKSCDYLGTCGDSFWSRFPWRQEDAQQKLWWLFDDCVANYSNSSVYSLEYLLLCSPVPQRCTSGTQLIVHFCVLLCSVPLVHFCVQPCTTSVYNRVPLVHLFVLPDSLITSISWFRQDPVPVKNIVMTVESKKLRKRRLALGQIVLELQVEGNISLFPKYFICRLPLWDIPLPMLYQYIAARSSPSFWDLLKDSYCTPIEGPRSVSFGRNCVLIAIIAFAPATGPNYE